MSLSLKMKNGDTGVQNEHNQGWNHIDILISKRTYNKDKNIDIYITKEED